MSRHATPRHVTSRHVTSRRVALRHITSRRVHMIETLYGHHKHVHRTRADVHMESAHRLPRMVRTRVRAVRAGTRERVAARVMTRVRSQAHASTPQHAHASFFGWYYLSNATCLMRRHLFYVFVAVSRSNALHYLPLLKKACVRQVVSDKWLPLKLPPARARAQSRGPGSEALRKRPWPRGPWASLASSG